MPKALPFVSYMSALPPLYLLQEQSSLYNALTKCLPLDRTFSASLSSNPSLACTEKTILLFSTFPPNSSLTLKNPPQVAYTPQLGPVPKGPTISPNSPTSQGPSVQTFKSLGDISQPNHCTWCHFLLLPPTFCCVQFNSAFCFKYCPCFNFRFLAEKVGLPPLKTFVKWL